ncbi:MAG: ATP-dependent DNA ligase [Thiohalocapsa sp.]|jgi:DNA ligase-1
MSSLSAVAATSAALAATPSRHAKVECIADLLRRCPRGEVGTVALWLTGESGRDRLGIGPAQIHRIRAAAPSAVASLGIGETRAWLAEIAAVSGAGSRTRRERLLSSLFATATAEEQLFLARLILGELRQGALAGLVAEGIARAFSVSATSVRRGWMLRGDLAEVAEIAHAEGRAGLERLALALFRPLQPMLAQPAEDLADAFSRIVRPILEYKLDGARVQVHKCAETVRIFSRQGNDVTVALPEIVEQVRAVPESELVLDGEVLALTAAGRPLPFQVTMSRFGRRSDDARLRAQLPLSLFCFDCLTCAGQTLIDLPTSERHRALAETLPRSLLVPRSASADMPAAQAFLAAALGAGHEGLMAKDPAAAYAAGGRGAHWLKIKQAHTLDLVVLAAEWGSGRRSGWLSNLHLGARADGGGLLMLGKTFKGLTDRLLAWQTGELLRREIGRDGQVVHVRPELVVEVAFNEVQQSRQYPAGLALRFARVKRYREDKSPDEADRVDAVRAIFEHQSPHAPVPRFAAGER